MLRVNNSLISFASAYRQLRPTEKVFVDGYVATVERDADRKGERISLALNRPIADSVIAASRGLLDRPMVRAAIVERINELAAASELTMGRVVKEIAGIALSSIGDYMNVDGNGQPTFDLAKATPEQLSRIKSIKIKENDGGLQRPATREFEFVLHDKIAALKMLADYMGLMSADNPHWRADQAQLAVRPALASDVSPDDAANAYAAMIND